jgi:hypothetical protein
MFNHKRAGKAAFMWLAGHALIFTFGLPASAQTDGLKMTTCTGSGGSVACITQYREGIINPHVRQVPEIRGERETAEADERDRRWTARCRPTVRHDAYGVKRYEYAAAGCEYGRSE